LLPDTEVLIRLGAKDPARLALGEWWRLVTPMFIHVGLLHFAMNSYVLVVIGRQLELAVGAAWFVGIYLLAGIAGNVASSVFSVNLSAGASGAIFGLMGLGLYLETTIDRRIAARTGRRQQRGAYAATVAINLAFGFLVPFIDNSAHLGGLLAGVLGAGVMVNLRRNRLQARRIGVGVALVGVTALLLAGGTYVGTSPELVLRHIEAATKAADDPEEKVYHLSQALEIDPKATDLRIERARLLFEHDEPRYALYDVKTAAAEPEARKALEALAAELDGKGKAKEAWQVRTLAAQAAHEGGATLEP
jgi:rhomboid protease GluP